MQIKKVGTCVLMWEGDYLESLSYSERTDHHPGFCTKCDGLTRLYSSLMVYSYT